MIPSVSTLQAMAGRFLTTSDLEAWHVDSQRRCRELVRAFQRKELDAVGLHAAFTSERIATSTPSPPTGVAVLSLMGVLTPTSSIFSFLGFGTSVRDFTQQLNAATADPKIKAIAVVTDSPGGSTRLVSEAANAMRQARAKKPVVGVVVGQACSAAFWVLSNASAIESTVSGSLGAIGVLTERLDVSKQLERDGVALHVVSSGTFKSEGHPALAMSDAERQALQRRVDVAYGQFIGDVAVGRHVAPTVVRAGDGEGRVVDAPEALRAGMIDRVSSVDETLARVVASPSALTALMQSRAEQLRASTDRHAFEAARAEIASHRQRLTAARRTMR